MFGAALHIHCGMGKTDIELVVNCLRKILFTVFGLAVDTETPRSIIAS